MAVSPTAIGALADEVVGGPVVEVRVELVDHALVSDHGEESDDECHLRPASRTPLSLE